MCDGDVALDQAVRVSLRGEEELPKSQIDKTFDLVNLPPELRSMIYASLIHTGDLSILRVSKLVSQEAVPLLSKVAILRINLGRPNTSRVTLNLTAELTLSGNLSLLAPDYIQHVDLRLHTGDRQECPIDTKPIYCVSGNRVTRKSCKITIQLEPYGLYPARLEESETYRAIAALTGFEMLTLKLEQYRNAESDGLMPLFRRESFRIALMNQGNSLAHSTLVLDYEIILKFLALTLGPAEFNKSVDQHSLKFRPKAYKSGGES